MLQSQLTKGQVAAALEALKVLNRGKNYSFTPPVAASAISPAGPKIPIAEEEFDRGWYLGYIDGRHVFQGKPKTNHRALEENLRECYFTVNFSGGAVAEELVDD